MNGDPSFRPLRVRWWSDGCSYAGVRERDGWRFYEKEDEAVRWFEISSTRQLIATAEDAIAAGEHVEELPPDVHSSDSTFLQSSRAKTIFICYAKVDQGKADSLFRYLKKSGFDPWMDKHRLVLGDNWELEIKRAVTQCDAFVPCLRPGFDEIGFRQQEVRWALEALGTRPHSPNFIVPFILEPCNLPEWCKPFHAGDHLHARTTPGDLIEALEKPARPQDP
jgi:TIR domain